MSSDDAAGAAVVAQAAGAAPRQPYFMSAGHEFHELSRVEAPPAAEWIGAVMEQAQVFASAWSLVGGRFDNGNGLMDAKAAKEELRAMLKAAPAPAPAPQRPAPQQPFTQAQMKRLYENSPEHQLDVKSRYAFYRIVGLVERAHGIGAATVSAAGEKTK